MLLAKVTLGGGAHFVNAENGFNYAYLYLVCSCNLEKFFHLNYFKILLTIFLKAIHVFNQLFLLSLHAVREPCRLPSNESPIIS